ncbi:Os07g0282700 [Oryza sativa Japonica Group]|uniref:Os07g0282700 protein n=1 Tax=Oryza sativa subsp. japonica TaxID=39947 RepID=A0A0N7KN95_ORYSJ|nr:Os07g0282700 [Oryza sativa Japonica Group]
MAAPSTSAGSRAGRRLRPHPRATPTPPPTAGDAASDSDRGLRRLRLRPRATPPPTPTAGSAACASDRGLRRLRLRPRATPPPPPTAGDTASAASTTARTSAYTSTGPSLQAPAGSGAPRRIRAPTARSGFGDDFFDFVLCPNDCECEVCEGSQFRPLTGKDHH